MTADLKARVQRSFSRSFATYHQASRQQAGIASQLIEALKSSGAPDRFAKALELGCGTGHLTQKLRQTFAIDALWLNDLAPEAQRTAQAAGATFLCGDAAQVVWPQAPDLIVSASMIQWLPDPKHFLLQAAKALAKGGWLAISGFGPEQYRELSETGSVAKAPGLCSVEDLARALAGPLEICAVGSQHQTRFFATPQDVLRHLRQTGVNGQAARGWTKSRLAQFVRDYDQKFGGSQGVPLTYHPIWVIARKPF